MKPGSKLLLLAIIVMTFFALSCGGGGSGDSGDQGTSEVTFSEFVGTWSGQFTAASSSDTLSGNTVLKVNSDGTGSMHFDFSNGNSDTHNISSFQVINDILHFNLPNSDPNDPDCANWDVEVTLSIAGSLGGGGTVCSSTGGMSITFSGSLAFSPPDSTADDGGDDSEVWSMTFTEYNGHLPYQTDSYVFYLDHYDFYSVSGYCLICCGGEINYWEIENGNLSASGECDSYIWQLNGIFSNNTCSGSYATANKDGSFRSEGIFTGYKE
jgi:hypothetical protein